MMGKKKLAMIREELRQAFAAEGSNPIAALDRKIRKLVKRGTPAAADFRSLLLLRDALAQVSQLQAQQRQRPAAPKRPKKAM